MQSSATLGLERSVGSSPVSGCRHATEGNICLLHAHKEADTTQTHPLSDCRNEKAGGFTATAERTYRVSVDSKAGRARKTARSSAQEATTKVQAEEKGFQINIRFICPR